MLVLGAAPLQRAGAQSVRGVVVHADGVTRAAGVIVAASHEQSGVVARTLSSENGDFELNVPGVGVYVLRVLRIGFRPTVLVPMTVPVNGVSGVRAVLGADAVVLAAVTVRSDNVCGSTEDAGRVVAQIWEETRTALTATQLSVGASALNVSWQAFQFSMDRGGARATEQSVLPRSGATERPFVSVGADSLARDGYVVRDGSDWVYRAPDAAALLSEQFAATHCFRVEPVSRARPQWIAVTFRPVPSRGDGIRDIAGTLWVDRASSELRLLEFQYTNLPAEANDPAVGGYVEYARMPTGHWVVARWAIRTPRLVRRSVGGGGVPGGGRQDLLTLHSISVTGGEVVRVRRGETTVYDADGAILAADESQATAPARPSACGAAMRPGFTLAGVVTQNARPTAGAVVRLSWQSGDSPESAVLSTVTDARGVFTLPCVARGVPITVTATHGPMTAGPTRLAPVTGRNAVVDIEFPPGMDQIR